MRKTQVKQKKRLKKTKQSPENAIDEEQRRIAEEMKKLLF